MTLQTALKLGRVSNLPTVWTNVLAGVALSGAAPTFELVGIVGVACTLLYIAGMYLNDAFDHRWDAQHRPERPIPSGEVTARTVFLAGFGMMAAALIVLATGPGGGRALWAGLALAAVIVVYDVTHKKNPLAAIVMALCRVGVYATAALAATAAPMTPFYVGCIFLFVYLVSLSIVARGEAKNPKLRPLVGVLIAGISLVDGMQLLALGHAWLAVVCVGAYVLTMAWQRRIAGT